MDDTKSPISVNIIDSEKTIPVKIEESEVEKKLVNKGDGQTLSPNTTEQQDKTTEGQRTINLIWEHTQAQIAKVSIYTGLSINMVVILLLIIFHSEITTAMIVVVLACLSSMNTTMGIIIGFYFSRTNHAAVGGLGKKPEQQYIGR